MVDSGAVLLSATFAGLVAIGATRAIERWGGRLGGVLGSIPTTIVPASLGIAAGSASPAEYQQAMLAVPAGMLLNAAYLLLWRLLPPRLPTGSPRLPLVLLGALTGWALGATLVVLGGAAWTAAGWPMLPLALVTTLVMLILGMRACLRPWPAPRGGQRVGPLVLLARGSLAATAIGAAVLIASTGHPLLAGLASVFPAIFTTTMVSLWLSQGEAVPTGAVGPMMLGSASVAVYALGASALVPAWGTVPGNASSWLIAVAGVSLPAALWLSRMRTMSATMPPRTPTLDTSGLGSSEVS